MSRGPWPLAAGRWRPHAAGARSRPATRRVHARGQALVELALILPVFLLLFAAALDLGRLFASQITLTGAAREGALEAARDGGKFLAGQDCTTANKSSNRVMCVTVNEAKGSFVTVSYQDVSMTCTPSPCPAAPALGDTVAIKVTGRFTLVTPILAAFFGGQTIDLSSTASAQLAVAPVLAAATPTPTATATATPTPTPTSTTTPACTAPVASFTVSPTSGLHYKNKNFPGTAFTFTNTSTVVEGPGCTATWSWNFGDGTGASSLESPPPYTYQAAAPSSPGYYLVTLAVSLPGVPSSTYSVQVPVS